MIRVRRLTLVLATMAALVLFPAVAQATTTQTIHINGVPIDVGSAGCVAGDITIIGNGVVHMTVNNAGDFWITETVEGAATDAAAGFSGHAAAWFGLEHNNGLSNVLHFIADAVGTLGDGTSLRIHQEGQFTVNAQGVLVVSRVVATCS
jgi:hypothetical protein